MHLCGFLLFLLSLTVIVQSANILTIIPFPSYSHQEPLLAVSKELALRGHNLTVITPNPPKERIPNYKAIDVSSAYNHLKNFEKMFGFTLQKPWNAFIFIGMQAPLFAAICDYELGLPQVQQFISEANHSSYDLVIMENLIYSSYYGLVHKIGSPPVVGIHTLAPWSLIDPLIGVPVNPSYMPDLFAGYTDKMNFFERVYNTILYWRTVHHLHTGILPAQEKVLRKYFGPDPPPVSEMEYNKSLILLPSDLTVSYPQPLPPNYIQIGPLHLKKPKPLPQDLQRWFDEAEDGVVYFSLGSNMKGTSLKLHQREAFVRAFSKFPKVRFLWKWESDQKIEGQTDNILTRKWLPQQDIFAHPKLRLFITQGGLQSTEEIVSHGIPVLGIPIFADQRHNIWKLAKENAALCVELHEVSFEPLYEALNQLLTNETFKQNAERLSRIAKDQLVPAMDSALWWIEYIIRHNGARHLRLASLDLNWFQYNLVDVYAFILSILLILGYLLYKTTKKIVLGLRINKLKTS